MENRFLIAFIPPKEVIQNLNRIRRIAQINVKRDSGLKMPHITIVDNSFKDIELVDNNLKDLLSKSESIKTKLNGISTFKVRKSIGIERYQENNSLIYLIKGNKEMYTLRKKILMALNTLKTPDRLKQWISENPKLSKSKIENIKKYGTPFNLQEWKFHTTLGLIPKKDEKKIIKQLKSLDLKNDIILNKIGLFIRNDGWKVYKIYNLNID